MEKEKFLKELKDFINEGWYYDSEEPDLRIINVDYLLDFIEWLEKQ